MAPVISQNNENHNTEIQNTERHNTENYETSNTKIPKKHNTEDHNIPKDLNTEWTKYRKPKTPNSQHTETTQYRHACPLQVRCEGEAFVYPVRLALKAKLSVFFLFGIYYSVFCTFWYCVLRYFDFRCKGTLGAICGTWAPSP